MQILSFRLISEPFSARLMGSEAASPIAPKAWRNALRTVLGISRESGQKVIRCFPKEANNKVRSGRRRDGLFATFVIEDHGCFCRSRWSGCAAGCSRAAGRVLLQVCQ